MNLTLAMILGSSVLVCIIVLVIKKVLRTQREQKEYENTYQALQRGRKLRPSLSFDQAQRIRNGINSGDPELDKVVRM